MDGNWGPFTHEGWAVFNDGSFMSIERIDELEVFASDAEVWDFLAGRIMAGSQPHIEAVREVFAANPSEADYLKAHWGPHLTRLIEPKLYP